MANHPYYIGIILNFVPMKTGLVLEGGAMRGMFTVGVTDVLMQQQIRFDGIIGVSAGACFGVNYKSHQIQRALRYNKLYASNWRYMSLWSWLTTGNYISKDFAYYHVPVHLDKFDFKTFNQDPTTFTLVCTDVHTGEPVYKEINHGDEGILEWIRATASMPILSVPVALDGREYLDGGISDSIPLKYFQDQGYEKNVVILTQPLGFVKKRTKLMPLFHLMMRKYPKIIEAMGRRHEMYNEQLAYLAQEEKKGNTLLIYPQNALPISRIESKPMLLQQVYDMGTAIGKSRCHEIQDFLTHI